MFSPVSSVLGFRVNVAVRSESLITEMPGLMTLYVAFLARYDYFRGVVLTNRIYTTATKSCKEDTSGI